ncbi:MAG: glycosyltransferase family 4 protein [Sulfuricaulis sp.]
MAIIPVMVRLAPRLGMIDKPDPRKVHTIPIPRVGGVGIVVGALAPLLLWEPMEPMVQAYIFGSLVLLTFGVWDDIRVLGHYTKFVGQFIAVIAVVYYGDVYITQLPFVQLQSNASIDFIGKPFTVFAIVGMINALNTSDGLDGLAGGISILSLCCISYLSYLAHGHTTILIALAGLGGTFGFLRYNTHPAIVFMGDGGSQFLGFTLGVLAVFLTQSENTALSPAIVLLLLGLPVIDLLAVIVQRVQRGAKWYRAYKDHIHHRLLGIGFVQYEAVVLIYGIQIFQATGALVLAYDSDFLVLSCYLILFAVIFAVLNIAERIGWKAHRVQGISRLAQVINAIKQHRLFLKLPTNFVVISISFLFVGTAFYAREIPSDVSIASGLLAAIMLLFLVLNRAKKSVVTQAINYVTGTFVIYLLTRHSGEPSLLAHDIEVGYFLVLAASIALGVRASKEAVFKTTPTDYLLVFVVLLAGILLKAIPAQENIAAMVAKFVVVFYGCELIINQMKNEWNILNLSTLASLCVLAVRGVA